MKTKKPKTAREVATRLIDRYFDTMTARGPVHVMASPVGRKQLIDMFARALRKAERDATRGGGG